MEIPVEQTTQAQAWVDWLLRLGPELFVAAVLIVLGYVLKMVSCIPGKAIPLIVICVGTCYYVVMAGNQVAPYWIEDPLPWRIGIGFVVSFGAWVLHNRVLDKWIDPLFENKKEKTKTIAGDSGKE